MQKIIPARRLTAVLCVAAVAALGITAAPALAKKPPKPPSNKALNRDVIKVDKALVTAIKTIGKTTKGLQSNVNTLNQGSATVVPEIAATNTTLTATNASLTALTAKVTALSSAFVAGSNTVTATLTQLGSGLTTVGNGLSALSTAVQDPNTGLPGLNEARPRFVTLTVASPGQPFTVAPNSSTPEETITVTQVSAGVALINFGEDVHERSLVVTPYPATPGTYPIGQAADCANLPNNTCAAGAGDPDVVLLQTQVLSGGAVTPFSVPVNVTALSG